MNYIWTFSYARHSELSSLLINMRREAWSATAGALRTALRNWARFSPREAHDVIAEKLRFDGTTERLFDQFLAITREDTVNKYTTWPVLVPLLAVSPDRLSVVSTASYTGTAQRVSEDCRTFKIYIADCHVYTSSVEFPHYDGI